MIVRMGLLQKKPGLSAAEFRAHWRDAHGSLAAKLPGLRRYHQNHVVDRQQRGITYARGSYDFDGISELWFDDLPSMQRASRANSSQSSRRTKQPSSVTSSWSLRFSSPWFRCPRARV